MINENTEKPTSTPKNFPYIAKFPVDLDQIEQASMLDKSKSLFALGDSEQGFVGGLVLDEKTYNIMVPAYNKGDGTEGKEVDKDGKRLPEFIRSLTSRQRGTNTLQNTGGNLHQQLVGRYQLVGKVVIGWGGWKKDKEGSDFSEIRFASTQQLFCFKYKAMFRVYFNMVFLNHSAHSQALPRECPLNIAERLQKSIRRKFKMAPIDFFQDPAIPEGIRAHYWVQKKWQDNPEECQKQVLLHLFINGEQSEFLDLLKEVKEEEKEVEQKEKTNFQQLYNENAPTITLMRGAKTGNLEQLKTYFSIQNRKNLDDLVDPANGDTALILAARSGQTAAVDFLLKSCQEEEKFSSNIFSRKKESSYLLNKKNYHGKTALLVAIENGHLETILTLLECKPNLEIVDKTGRNALTLALEKGNHEIIDCLIKAGAEISTALAVIARNSDQASLNTFIKYSQEKQGLDLNSLITKKIEDIYEKIDMMDNPASALDIAAAFSHKEFFKLLVKNCSPQYIANESRGAFLCWAVFYDRPEIIKQFVEVFSDDIDEKKEHPGTNLYQRISSIFSGKQVDLLEYAVHHQKKECIKLLLQDGFKVSYAFFNYVLATGNIELIDYIDPVQENLQLAFHFGPQITMQLIQKITDINDSENFSNGSGDTPLTAAIKYKCPLELVRFIIEECKANIDHLGKGKKTPLMVAVESKNVEMVNLLLEFKPNLSLCDSQNQTIFDYVKNSNFKIRKLFSGDLEPTNLSDNRYGFDYSEESHQTEEENDSSNSDCLVQ